MSAVAKKRLGELLIEAGVVDATQLQAALGHQRQWGMRLGQALVDLKLVREGDIVAALARKFGYEVARMDALDPYALEQAQKLVPREFAVRNNVFPMSADTNTITVAMADPTNLAVVDELAFRTGRRVKVCIGGDRAIAAALREQDPPEDRAVESIALDLGGEEADRPLLDDPFGGGSKDALEAFFGGVEPGGPEPRARAVPPPEATFTQGDIGAPAAFAPIPPFPPAAPSAVAPPPAPAAPSVAPAPAPVRPPPMPQAVAPAPRPPPPRPTATGIPTASGPAAAAPPAAARLPGPGPASAPRPTTTGLPAGAPPVAPRPISNGLPVAAPAGPALPPAQARPPVVAPPLAPARPPLARPPTATAIPMSTAPAATGAAPVAQSPSPSPPAPPPARAPAPPPARSPASADGRDLLGVVPKGGFSGEEFDTLEGPELEPILEDEQVEGRQPESVLTERERGILASLARLARGAPAEPEIVKPTQAVAALILALLRRKVISERDFLDELRER